MRQGITAKSSTQNKEARPVRECNRGGTTATYMSSSCVGNVERKGIFLFFDIKIRIRRRVTND